MLGLLRQTGSRPCVQPATRMQRDGKGEAFGRFLNFCHDIFSLVAPGDLYDLFLTVPRIGDLVAGTAMPGASLSSEAAAGPADHAMPVSSSGFSLP